MTRVQKYGLGAGVVLLVALLGALLVGVHERRLQRAAEAERNAPSRSGQQALSGRIGDIAPRMPETPPGQPGQGSPNVVILPKGYDPNRGESEAMKQPGAVRGRDVTKVVPREEHPQVPPPPPMDTPEDLQRERRH